MWGLVVASTDIGRDVIHDEDGRHLVPPIHAARWRLVVDAPGDRPELTGRPVSFEGFRLADGSYVGWTMGPGTVLLLRVTRPGASWWDGASTMTDEPGLLWDARVIGLHDSVPSAHTAADTVFAKRG